MPDEKTIPKEEAKKQEAKSTPATDKKQAPLKRESTVELPKPAAGSKAEPPKSSADNGKKQPEPEIKTPAAEKKPDESPRKPAEVKPVPPKEEKKPPEKKEPVAEPQKPAPVPPPMEPQTNSPEVPKSVKITQVFESRLTKPSDAELKNLPIPKEGEGYFIQLHPAYFFEFLDHPFSINREVKDYKELYDSIKENGINEPIKARPRPDGGLEVLSGHRRRDIATQLNYPIPVVVVQMDDDTARIEVVDGNLHRQDIPTSELARAAKMKMEALARKVGRRSKMEQLTEPAKRTDQIVAEDMGISRNQVNRLVRIDSLVPELKQQVDEKKLPFNTAVELSYMKPEEQNVVVDYMAKEQIVPSMAQATQLKEASREVDTLKKTAPALVNDRKVDEKKVASIIQPRKEPELKVTFSATELKPYFPDRQPTVPEAKRAMFEAMELRKKALERQAKKQQIKDDLQKQDR